MVLFCNGRITPFFVYPGRKRYEKSQNLSSGTAGASGGGPGAGGRPCWGWACPPVAPRPLPQAQADPPAPGGTVPPPQTPPDQPEEPLTPPEEPQEPEQPDYPGSARPAGHPPGEPDTPPEDPGQVTWTRTPPPKRPTAPGRHPRRYPIPPPWPPPDDALPTGSSRTPCSGEITDDQLATDGHPAFYAYILNANGQTLKVKLRNSQTSQNGQYLTADGRNYQARPAGGETNHFTPFYRKGRHKNRPGGESTPSLRPRRADELPHPSATIPPPSSPTWRASPKPPTATYP